MMVMVLNLLHWAQLLFCDRRFRFRPKVTVFFGFPISLRRLMSFLGRTAVFVKDNLHETFSDSQQSSPTFFLLILSTILGVYDRLFEVFSTTWKIPCMLFTENRKYFLSELDRFWKHHFCASKVSSSPGFRLSQPLSWFGCLWFHTAEWGKRPKQGREHIYAIFLVV